MFIIIVLKHLETKPGVFRNLDHVSFCFNITQQYITFGIAAIINAQYQIANDIFVLDISYLFFSASLIRSFPKTNPNCNWDAKIPPTKAIPTLNKNDNSLSVTPLVVVVV